VLILTANTIGSAAAKPPLERGQAQLLFAGPKRLTLWFIVRSDARRCCAAARHVRGDEGKAAGCSPGRRLCCL